jgi:hypothetical protein
MSIISKTQARHNSRRENVPERRAQRRVGRFALLAASALTALANAATNKSQNGCSSLSLHSFGYN